MGNSREKEGCLVLVKSCPMQRINDVECQRQCWAWQRIIQQVWLREAKKIAFQQHKVFEDALEIDLDMEIRRVVHAIFQNMSFDNTSSRTYNVT